MATTNPTSAASTKKDVKEKKAPVPLNQRIDTQVTKAVLNGQMTHDELKKLADRFAKLHAFMTSDMQ